MALAHDPLKLRQIGLIQVAVGNPGIETMPLQFGAAMYGEMFGAGQRLEVFGIVALQALNERHRQPRRKERVLSVSFLAAMLMFGVQNVRP